MRKMLGSFAVLAAAAAFVAAGVQAAPAAHQARATAPRAWATKVCSAVSTWQKHLQRRSGALNHVSGGDLPGLRRKLVAFLSGVVSDTNVLVRAVDRAGAPSVPHGVAIQRQLHNGFAQTRSFFAKDVVTAKALPVGSPVKFASGANALAKAIGRQGSQITVSFERIQTKYGSTKLHGAMKPIAACSALG